MTSLGQTCVALFAMSRDDRKYGNLSAKACMRQALNIHNRVNAVATLCMAKQLQHNHHRASGEADDILGHRAREVTDQRMFAGARHHNHASIYILCVLDYRGANFSAAMPHIIE